MTIMAGVTIISSRLKKKKLSNLFQENEINDEWKKKEMDVVVAKKVAKSAGNFESPLENT